MPCASRVNVKIEISPSVQPAEVWNTGLYSLLIFRKHWQSSWCFTRWWPLPLQVWCRLVTAAYNYFHVTNFFWMFGEGCYLHTAVVLTYSTDKLQKWMFTCIGWGQSAILCLFSPPTVGRQFTCLSLCTVCQQVFRFQSLWPGHLGSFTMTMKSESHYNHPDGLSRPPIGVCLVVYNGLPQCPDSQSKRRILWHPAPITTWSAIVLIDRCWFGKRAGVYTDYIYQGPMILVLLVGTPSVSPKYCLNVVVTLWKRNKLQQTVRSNESLKSDATSESIRTLASNHHISWTPLHQPHWALLLLRLILSSCSTLCGF